MVLVNSIKARLALRSDTEFEQAMLRVVIGVGLFVYLLPDANKHSTEWVYSSKAYLIVMAAFMLASIAFLGAIILRPRPCPTRRVAANAVDVITITFFMVFGGEYTAALFGLYLWITFGCGFRFGPRYLVVSLALCIGGFSTVLALSEFWSNKIVFGVGLLIGMFGLSLYVLVLITRLYQAIERTEAANQAKRVFVSSVSHELRTPLNAIIGMNEVLRTTRLNGEQAEMVHTMHDASRVMLSLIEGVLDFSKIEAGKLTLESADFDLHELVRRTVTIFSQQAASKKLKLGAFIMPDVTPSLKGDARHLQQILLNLIGNAVKFTDQGEIQLSVSALIQGQDSVRLRFAVRDTGIGIPDVDQGRIFESFAQVESPNARKHRGTGLGTTIAKQLVELMGGTIGLDSVPGSGSTFWFEIPFAKQLAVARPSSDHFTQSRVLFVGFPKSAHQVLATEVSQWQIESGAADNSTFALARMSEAKQAGKAYSAALVYTEDASSENIGRLAVKLRADPIDSLPLILCLPRKTALQLGTRVPTDYASVVALPAETRLLYNALHSVFAGEQAATGVVSLADYYKQRKSSAKTFRVLVADDDQVNRRVIAKQLEIAGHEVTLVADGEQVLDALEGTDGDYDVVILDSNMPVMTGIEATRLIRVMQAGQASVPIIMFSADTTKETIQEATEAGVNVFLPKPVEAGKLFATIEELAEQRARVSLRVVQAGIAPNTVPFAVLVDLPTLVELERMSQDADFVSQLVELFKQDSSALARKIDDALQQQSFDQLKLHVHALTGSALNLGAQRLVAHCKKMKGLTSEELTGHASALRSETHAVITQTQTALSDYLRTRVRPVENSVEGNLHHS